jgi:hypothetical protein
VKEPAYQANADSRDRGALVWPLLGDSKIDIMHRINHQEAYSLPGEIYTNNQSPL